MFLAASIQNRGFFIVDRDAVARSKARVHRKVANVSARIGAILRNRNVALVA